MMIKFILPPYNLRSSLDFCSKYIQDELSSCKNSLWTTIKPAKNLKGYAFFSTHKYGAPKQFETELLNFKCLPITTVALPFIYSISPASCTATKYKYVSPQCL